MKALLIVLASVFTFVGCSTLPTKDSIAGFYTNTVVQDEPWRYLNLARNGRYSAEAHFVTIIVEGTDGIERDAGSWSLAGESIVLTSIDGNKCEARLRRMDGKWTIEWNGIEFIRRQKPLPANLTAENAPDSCLTLPACAP